MDDKKNAVDHILVIGAGMAGIEASLTLSAAGRKVYLVEREPLFGGSVIKFEEVYANMECSTCMAAPKQQEVLQSDNIELLTLSEVRKVSGKAGDFTVKILKKARYVNLESCIGCDMCFEPCPVSIPNEFQENLGERKAIYTSCPGALPNVPMIDTGNCLRFKGEDCQLCKEACMFEAVDFEEKDEEIELKVSSIIVATGFCVQDVNQIPGSGYSKTGNVFTAMEMERLYASNGPTEGKIILRNGEEPCSAAIIHCVGRKEIGYCSAICCMNSLKIIYYLKHKIPEIKIYEFYSDLCVPGKSYQEFYDKVRKKIEPVRFRDIKINQQDKNVKISYTTLSGKDEALEVDMAILSPAIVPPEGAEELAGILGIKSEKMGFYSTGSISSSPVYSGRDGIYLAGCIEGPKDVGESIAQADAAAGRVLSVQL